MLKGWLLVEAIRQLVDKRKFTKRTQMTEEIKGIYFSTLATSDAFEPSRGARNAKTNPLRLIEYQRIYQTKPNC
jgi:hypothetical protein